MVCQLVERYQVPSGAGASATDPFPSDLGAIDSESDAPQDDIFPALPGHHVLLRRGSRSRHGPALATSGSALGVAFIEGTRLRFGVSSAEAHEASSFTFTDIIDVPDARTLDPLLAGDAQGFYYGWVVDGGTRSAQILSARLDRRGRIEQGPWQLASSELACAISSGADMLAVACTSREGASYETWVELCSGDQHCLRCFLGESPYLVRPALVWDGSAFDLVYASSTALKLARVAVSGEEVLRPVQLEGFEPDDRNEPAVAFDGEALAVVHGADLRVFDLRGRLLRGPWALPGTGTESQVVSTTDGHAVLRKAGLAASDTAVSWIGAGGLSGSTLLAPATGSHSFPPGVTAAIVRADGAVFTVHEVQDGAGAGSSLVLARFDEVDGALARDPQLLGPDSAALQPIAIRCEPNVCHVLADAPSAGVGYPERSYGLWRVEPDTDAVTPPTAEATARGLALTTPAMGDAGAATLLLHPDSDEAPYLTLWRYDGSWSKAVCPEGSYEAGASLFFENEALRLLYGDARDSALLNETLFSDGRFQTPSWVGAEGVQARCGDAYYAFAQGDPNTAQRWRPELDTAFSRVFSVTSSTAQYGLCCNDRLLAMQGSVLSLEGEWVASPDSTHRGCTSAGDSLLLVAPWPYANGLLLVRVSPAGELLRWRLTMPEGVKGPGPNTLASGDVTSPEIPWALSSDRSQIALAWYDPEWGDAFVSTWRLPE